MAREDAAGFTLIELVVVLIVAGVLAAVGASRFFVLKDFQDRGFHDATLAAVRYAQKVAVASGCDVEVRIGGGGFALDERSGCTGGGFSVPVRRPGSGGAFAASAPSGVTVGTLDFYYDALGRPHAPGGAPLSAPATVTVGAGTITVERETGFVH